MGIHFKGNVFTITGVFWRIGVIIATKLNWEQYEVIYRDGGFILKGTFSLLVESSRG